MTPGPGIQRTPLPKGFTASGVNCGVRRYRPDLGIVISDRPSVAVGVFTQNQCKAAPVTHCQNLLPSDQIRAIVTNSGQANAATGPEGVENNRAMAFAVAKELTCLPRQVLTASTGVIGQQLEIGKIVEAMPELVERSTDTAESFALAILTTDLVPKTVTTTVTLSQGDVRITGICKGSGMIHPNMATMLGYVLTDCDVPLGLAQDILVDATNVSFNMISVDGDTSTNDCCFLMANGASGVPLKTVEDLIAFKSAVTDIMKLLAQSIAVDGEGATKLIEVRLSHAPDLSLARRAARGVTLSPLVKTAIHGEDPNWGRILARLGAEQVPGPLLETMTLKMQGFTLFENGRPSPVDREAVRATLKTDKILIEVNLKAGSFEATAWGCDLSKKYVDINTEYPT
ncbi:MAG: bifunctional glutamate N-acetyltransferase/amino-acid acetyltransferase ArgJ [Bdellovibrionaceae bacterium]|nr:bifunctional glutamate N-acetyltransferase/amino-acid acetyltransferase ArgJ [Pseudobdellovibrionaceae bacterium]